MFMLWYACTLWLCLCHDVHVLWTCTFMSWCTCCDYVCVMIFTCCDYVHVMTCTLWLRLCHDVCCIYVHVMIHLCDDKFDYGGLVWWDLCYCMFIVSLGRWWCNNVRWWVWLSDVEFVLSVCGFVGWMMRCSGGTYPQPVWVEMVLSWIVLLHLGVESA